jgi:hypothetical protein
VQEQEQGQEQEPIYILLMKSNIMQKINTYKNGSRSTASQRHQLWKSSILLLEINRKITILCLDIILFQRQPYREWKNQTYRLREGSRNIKPKGLDDRRGYLGRDPAPLGAIHRSFVSFVSLRRDSSPSGRVWRCIIVP